jgi:protoporphyrinogen/coproporphyrinogen III oxidase
MSPGASRRHVVVVGAGIAGLATAYRLVRSANGFPIDVTVLEAGREPGGKLRPVEVAGILVEGGADSFVVRKPWAVDLCKEVGLGGELIVPGTSGAFVWTRGRLVPFPARSAFGIPSDASGLLRWPGLPFGARVRALGDLWKWPRKDDADESLGSLVGRRMGRDAVDTLVAPLLAGLHAGDVDRLSVQATFPELRRWERDHGSLMRGARASLNGAARLGDATEDRSLAAKPAAAGPMFATVWGGLIRLVETLENAIRPSRIHLQSPVSGILPPPPGPRGAGGFVVQVGEERHTADAVVLATPAFESARLLRPVNPEAAGELDAIGYASTAVVALAYPDGTAERLPDRTGFVVPARDGVITACTWLSRKWPSDVFGDRAVVRCFAGSAVDPAPLDLSDEDLVAAVDREVQRATPLGAAPADATVVRWNRAMPQYEVGHLERLARIEGAVAKTPGVFVVGSAYDGIGIADCVRQAAEVTGRVRSYLHGVGTTQPGGEMESEAFGWKK